MSDFIQIWDEKTRNRKKKAELKRIRQSLKMIEEATMSNVEGLIESAAFHRVAIMELEQIIARDGYVDSYQNGANQKGLKKSSAVEIYDRMINTYLKIVKQLCDLMPSESAFDPGKELLDFIKR